MRVTNLDTDQVSPFQLRNISNSLTRENSIGQRILVGGYATGASVGGNVIFADSFLCDNAAISGDVVLNDSSIVGDDSQLDGSISLTNTRVENSVLSWDCYL